jgi:hypothetical protein
MTHIAQFIINKKAKKETFDYAVKIEGEHRTNHPLAPKLLITVLIVEMDLSFD